MAPYIEQTLRSVIDQNYPNLEYIVIDGGSTDGTQEIIARYRNYITYYASEPDRGMYDALQKGFARVTGDVLAWLNADDIYFPWTLQVVNDVFTQYKDINWIGGKYAFLNENGTLSQIFPKCSARTPKDIRNGWCREGLLGPLQQESMFWRRSLYQQSGGLDASYRYAGDFELWMRFAKYASLVKMDMPLAAFRRRKDSLSAAGCKQYQLEVERAIENAPRYPGVLWKMMRGKRLMIQLLRMLRIHRQEVCFYDISTQQCSRKNTWMSAGNHTLQSILIYR